MSEYRISDINMLQSASVSGTYIPIKDYLGPTRIFLRSMCDSISVYPIALKKAKIICNFGLFGCNRVNIPKVSTINLRNLLEH